MQEAFSDYKNTAPAEAYEIAKYAALNRDKNIGVITPFVNQKKLIEEELERAKVTNVSCGTVHAFQGDEKDVILFSTAITDQTQAGTYEWLKNNKELINVAASRTLGVKPFSSVTEEAFLENLTHALENIWLTQSRYTIHKEVAIAHVFQDNESYNDLFYNGRFDFVVYEKQGRRELPILAIELDGKEHFESEVVMNRDKKKNAICEEHNLQLIRVENSYARRKRSVSFFRRA